MMWKVGDFWCDYDFGYLCLVVWIDDNVLVDGCNGVV